MQLVRHAEQLQTLAQLDPAAGPTMTAVVEVLGELAAVLEVLAADDRGPVERPARYPAGHRHQLDG
jgi:hypothetical protein